MLFDVNEDANGPLSVVSMIDEVLKDLDGQGYLSEKNVELIRMNGGPAELEKAVGWDYTRAVKRMRFKDVREDDWFYDAVRSVYEKGQMNGLSKTAFAPKDPLNRAMLVMILWRMDGSPASEGDGGDFTDVEPGSWYEEAVNWAAEKGIAKGFEDGTFRPDTEITREQAVTILWRMNGSPASEGDGGGFTDTDRISEWAAEAMEWGVSSGLISGRGNGKLAPQDTITRAEAAALLQRLETEN